MHVACHPRVRAGPRCRNQDRDRAHYRDRAIGLNRIGLGLGLIVAFSLGLAAVFCLLGLLLVRSSGIVDHFGTIGQRTQRLLPLGSAIVVTILGVAISAKGALAYLA